MGMGRRPTSSPKIEAGWLKKRGVGSENLSHSWFYQRSSLSAEIYFYHIPSEKASEKYGGQPLPNL